MSDEVEEIAETPTAPVPLAGAEAAPLTGPILVAPFSMVVPTVLGQIIVNRHDINQTNVLVKTGYPPNWRDIVTIQQTLQARGTDQVAVDVGANFGCFALGMAQAVGPMGAVHAFEPQRLIFNMLAGTVALNSLTRVWCHHAALGSSEGSLEIPQYDPFQPLNFGSVEFGGEQIEPLHQVRGNDPRRADFVPLRTLDSLRFERVDLIKIDAEGMEIEVFDGATETIGRCRPVLYIETVKIERRTLNERLTAADYLAYPHGPQYLCIPREDAGRYAISYA